MYNDVIFVICSNLCVSFSDKLIISDPVEFHDRSFLAHLYQLPWAEPLFTRRVEQSMLLGKHMTFCRVSNETLSLVWIKAKFYNIDCEKYMWSTPQSAEIIRFPNFTTLVKPASHCPFHSQRHHLDRSSSNAILNNSPECQFYYMIAFLAVAPYFIDVWEQNLRNFAVI